MPIDLSSSHLAGEDRGGGQVAACFSYFFQHTSNVHQNIIIPESQYHKTLLFQVFIANAICITSAMLSAVSLYNKSLFEANEINDVVVYRNLSPEPQAPHLVQPNVFP